jgi:transcriptional regulator GlxA family with amidase domain
VGNHCHCALRDLIVSQLQKVCPVSTLLTLPTESRALVVAQAYIAKQAEAPLLHAVCKDAGVSVRTIERIFRKDVGMSFEVWRRQVRLMKAIELLVEGYSLKQIASKVGYRQTSALVELFRQTLGTTPKAWISCLTKPN